MHVRRRIKGRLVYSSQDEVKVELPLGRDKRQDVARRDARRAVIRELGRRVKGMS